MATQGMGDASSKAMDEIFRMIDGIDKRPEREILLSIEALLKQLVLQSAPTDSGKDTP